MKKQFFRVKQIADQTFLRAEKSEVLNADLQNAEKRVEAIKQICQNTLKKLSSCLHGIGTEVSFEKKMKKMPEGVLASVLADSGAILKENSILGSTLGDCSQLQETLCKFKLNFELEAEKQVLSQLSNILEVDLPNISKLRKQLNKLTLDMDSTKTRYINAVRHSQQVTGTALITAASKVEQLKEELEDATNKVEQMKDSLAAEMFALISREPEICQLIIKWYSLQATYHKESLKALEEALPLLDVSIEKSHQKPVFGCSLDQHLSIAERQIAWVLETCICFLLECGLNEEGLFRIAGSASKVKKLKNSFDAGIVDMSDYIKDPHAVAGVMKSYLRELPEPLLTLGLYDEWLTAAKVPDPNDRLQALWTVLHKLPPSNFQNLRYLIKFLSRLSSNNEVTKMSSQNLAIVLAPNLIWMPKEESISHIGLNMNAANIHSSIVDTLITYANWFFPEEIEFYQTISQGFLENKTTNGEIEMEFSFDSSPKVSHRPGKKPAPPVPPHLVSVSNAEKSTCSADNAVIPPSSSPLGLPSSSTTEKNSKTHLHVSDQQSLSQSQLEHLNSHPSQNASEKFSVANPSNPEGSNLSSSPTTTALDKQAKTSPLPPENSLPPEVNNPLDKKSSSYFPFSLDPPEKPERTSIICKSSNENLFTSSTSKPNVPEKPIHYSTMSLERPVKMRASRGDRSDVRLSVIERPTVPPPERPQRPSPLATGDSSNPSSQSLSLNTAHLSFVDELESEEENPSSIMTKSLEKWDFLLGPNSGAPPDRPPRSHEEGFKARQRCPPPVPPAKPKHVPSPTTETSQPPSTC